MALRAFFFLARPIQIRKEAKTRGGLCRRDFSVAVYRRLRPRHVVCQPHSIRVQVPTTTCLKKICKKDLQNSSD